MAKDVSDTVRDALGTAVREALSNMGEAPPANAKPGLLSGVKGMAAGIALAAAAPLALKRMDSVRETVSSKAERGSRRRRAGHGQAAGRGDESESDGEGGGDSDGSKGGVAGRGKGRRMPVQQAVDVAVPIETAYNQWTQFEDWPTFMHRVTNVSQDDDCTVSFSTKIWTRKREFTAKIETQRPDERIKWDVVAGHHPHGRRDVPRAGPAAHPDRALPRRRLWLADREGGPRYAPRQARRARRPASLQGLHRDGGASRPARGAASSRMASWSRRTTTPTTRSVTTRALRTSSRMRAGPRRTTLTKRPTTSTTRAERWRSASAPSGSRRQAEQHRAERSDDDESEAMASGSREREHRLSSSGSRSSGSRSRVAEQRG